MVTFRQAWDWLLGRDEPKPPDPDKIVGAAWLPLIEAPIAVAELNAQGIPATFAEGSAMYPGIQVRGPAAKIFVTEDRREEAVAVLTELFGRPPSDQPL